MGRPIASDYDDKRRHILNVAAKVFAQTGIARASMNEVARACGVSKASIYHYYASKDELVFDILDSYLSELIDFVQAQPQEAKTPAERLYAATRAFLLAYEGMDHEHKIQNEGLALLPQDKQEILKNHQRELVQFVAKILRDCAPERLGVDKKLCREITMSVFGMLNWYFMWQPGATKEDRLRYAKVVANVTLHGIQIGGTQDM